MAAVKGMGSVKRFGARYGRKIKYRVAKVESELKKKHECPYCKYPKAKRIASGIWICRKCGAKFTGKAYTIPKKIIIKEEIPETGKKEE